MLLYANPFRETEFLEFPIEFRVIRIVAYYSVTRVAPFRHSVFADEGERGTNIEVFSPRVAIERCFPMRARYSGFTALSFIFG